MVAMLDDELKREQEQRLYRAYTATVLRDIAYASFHGRYERQSYQELLDDIEKPHLVDDRSATQIIQYIADKL